jgi:putative transcriptional regulator
VERYDPIFVNTDLLLNKIHDARKSRGWTQEELAARANVTRQTIIAIEKGNYVPSLTLAIKLAKVFKVRVEEIFIYVER